MKRLLGKAGMVRAAPVRRIEIIEFLDRSGQESAAERTVRDEGDAEFAAGGEDAVGLDVPGPQRVLALQSGDCVNLCCAAQRLRPGFGKAQGADFAGRD